jgi:hypothetical protein
MVGLLLNNELEECGGKQSWPDLRYCPGICLEGLRITMKYPSQDGWCADQNSEQASAPEHKPEAYWLIELALSHHNLAFTYQKEEEERKKILS